MHKKNYFIMVVVATISFNIIGSKSNSTIKNLTGFMNIARGGTLDVESRRIVLPRKDVEALTGKREFKQYCPSEFVGTVSSYVRRSIATIKKLKLAEKERLKAELRAFKVVVSNKINSITVNEDVSLSSDKQKCSMNAKKLYMGAIRDLKKAIKFLPDIDIEANKHLFCCSIF